MASRDPSVYNLMCGKVFFAMLTCPVMTISRRADGSEIKTKIFRIAIMSRGDDFQES